MSEIETHEFVFDLSGGLPCLDFANTVSGRLQPQMREHLNRYSDLVSWALQAGVVTEGTAQHLLDEAARRPEEAVAALDRARALREAIYRIFRAIANEQSPADDDLTALNAALADALAHARIVEAPDGFTWGWIEEDGSLDRAVWPVVRSAADLLTSEDLHAVRECAGDDCAWLFIDTSKNRSRRWCDMKVCGNRAKVRRFYEKRKGVK